MEFGTTTARPRQVGFLNLDLLLRSAKLNAITDLIINKVDILEQVGVWKVVKEGKILDLKDKKEFTRFVTNLAIKEVDTLKRVVLSESPEEI